MARVGAALATYLGISGSSQEGMILRLLIELGAQIVGAEEGSLLVHDEKRRELVFAMTIGSTWSGNPPMLISVSGTDRSVIHNMNGAWRSSNVSPRP